MSSLAFCLDAALDPTQSLHLLPCASCATSPIPAAALLLLLPAVNTDTETAVVNVTYATKEEAKV